MLNYHELTMNEPRDSPQRRKQFLVIAAIMFGMFLHSSLDAGAFAGLEITGGTFPGGDFVYKAMTKDYAASTGTLRTVASDLGHAEDVRSEQSDLLYALFWDDPSRVPGGKARFAGGVLLSKATSGEEGKRMKKALLEEANGAIDARAKGAVGEEDTGTHSKDVRYEAGSLPKVAAAVAQHPFTAGAWSAILQSYKILPKLKEYANTHGEVGKSPIIIATCSAKQKMCTYYMPLAKRDKFYMGKPKMEDYAEQFAHTESLLQRMGLNFGDAWRGLQKAVGIGSSPRNNENEEL